MKWALYLLLAGTLLSGIMAFTNAGQAAPDAKEAAR